MVVKPMKNICSMTCVRSGAAAPRLGDWRKGFTLIELLAVIAIIAVLAGLVMGTAGMATSKSRESKTRGEHAKLVTAIESYKQDMGNYPPDNIMTDGEFVDPVVRAGRNSLFWELGGATYHNGEFRSIGGDHVIKATELRTALGARGVENSVRWDPASPGRKPRPPFRGVTFKKSEFAELDLPGDVDILVNQLKGPHDGKFKKRGSNLGVNPWFYNASSTNRHNTDGFDLWTEYIAREGTNVIGNWND